MSKCLWCYGESLICVKNRLDTERWKHPCGEDSELGDKVDDSLQYHT